MFPALSFVNTTQLAIFLLVWCDLNRSAGNRLLLYYFDILYIVDLYFKFARFRKHRYKSLM